MKTDIKGLLPVPEGYSEPVMGRLRCLNYKCNSDAALFSEGKWRKNQVGNSTNHFYSLRLGSPIYEANKAMFKLKGHPHAALMLEYAKDAAETETPWKQWRFKRLNNQNWTFCSSSPTWSSSYEYERMPTPPKTININGIEVPEPVREPLNFGDEYVALDLICVIDDIEWFGDDWDMENLHLGIIHLTKEAAEIHRKALLSFTAKEDAQ